MLKLCPYKSKQVKKFTDEILVFSNSKIYFTFLNNDGIVEVIADLAHAVEGLVWWC